MGNKFSYNHPIRLALFIIAVALLIPALIFVYQDTLLKGFIRPGIGQVYAYVSLSKDEQAKINYPIPKYLLRYFHSHPDNKQIEVYRIFGLERRKNFTYTFIYAAHNLYNKDLFNWYSSYRYFVLKMKEKNGIYEINGVIEQPNTCFGYKFEDGIKWYSPVYGRDATLCTLSRIFPKQFLETAISEKVFNELIKEMKKKEIKLKR